MATIPARQPEVKKITARALTYVLEGVERAYPAYQFSGVNKYERPGSNPFAFAATPETRVSEQGDTRLSETGDTRIAEDFGG